MPGADRRLIQRLSAVAALIDAVGLSVVGARVKRLRLQQGHSIRSFAELSGLGKNSIVRLESGVGTQPLTLLRACEALGLHIDRLADPVAPDPATAAAHHNEDDRWHALMDLAGGPLGDADGPVAPEVRARLAAEQGVAVAINRLKSRLPTGRIFPSLLELHAASEPRSHPGEELVFVLQGSVCLQVGGVPYPLKAGESLTFWSSEQHVYAPAADSDCTPIVLSVRTQG